MRRFRWLLAWLLLAAGIALAVFYGRAVLHFLGWDGQTSDNYAAWSGSVPAIETGLGMSTLITGLWHGLNCHKPGCWRLGRHKVAGSPWCNHHHTEAREDPDPVLERLDAIIVLLGGDSAPPP